MRFWTPAAIYTAALVAICVAVMQYHAIAFWSEHAALTTGWLWAIGIEMAVLWLWFQRTLRHRLVGTVGTIVLLAGPLYAISGDLLESLSTMQQREALVEAKQADIEDQRRSIEEQARGLRDRISEVEADLQAFRENSRERTGWLPAIEEAQQTIGRIHEQRMALLAERREVTRRGQEELAQLRSGHSNIHLDAFLLAVQAVGLVLFHLVAILGITWLSHRRSQNLLVQDSHFSHPSSHSSHSAKPMAARVSHVPNDNHPLGAPLVRPAAAIRTPESEGAKSANSKSSLSNQDDALFLRINANTPNVLSKREPEGANADANADAKSANARTLPGIDDAPSSTKNLYRGVVFAHSGADANLAEEGQHGARTDSLSPPSVGAERSRQGDGVPLAEIQWAAQKIQRFIDNDILTAAEFAQQSGVPRTDVSYFLNHQERLAEGKRTASQRSIRKIIREAAQLKEKSI